MGTLSASSPTLEIDSAELVKWGYIWRTGTKVRSAKLDEDEGDVVEDDSDDGDGGDVPTQERVSQVVRPEDIGVPEEVLETFRPDRKYPNAFDKRQGMAFGSVFDGAVGAALAKMLGDINIHQFAANRRASALLPRYPDCVEVGPVRVVGGVRPQNFDVAYRPDGVRIAFDSKTLNDVSSIRKNWQNMVNDLGTEATTVHTRFPYAVVGFMVAVPRPALQAAQEADLVRTLERLGSREHVLDQAHLAEAIALVVWDPVDGSIDPSVPAVGSGLRFEEFMPRIHRAYVERYKGLPPHDR